MNSKTKFFTLIPGVILALIFPFIFIYVLVNFSPLLIKAHFTSFLAFKWSPTSENYGILAMVWGSLYVSILSLLFAFPVGLGTGIFLYDFCPLSVKDPLQKIIYLLANIPPVIYGFVGIVLILPYLRIILGGIGYSIVASAIMLSILITPYIVIASFSSLSSVPSEYYEAALALGANKAEILFHVALPIAWKGIVSGILLGFSRAIGETMIVLMLSGNVTQIAISPLLPVRTLTGNIALEISDAVGLHRQALFLCAFVLLVLVIMMDHIITKFAPGVLNNLIKKQPIQSG